MKKVSLPNSQKQTTQLGLGCAFWSSVGESEAGRILDAAYDAGIRHFDVGPSYANGAAEGYLGKFLSKRTDVTITTKYGVIAFSHETLPTKLARILLKPASKGLRAGVKLPFQAKIAAISRRKAKYTTEEMQASLKRSLAHLKRDHVDIFLLHEPDPEDLDRQDLMNSLRSSVGKGRIGSLGIGTQYQEAEALARAHGKPWDVMQYEWTAYRGALLFPDAFQILFWITGRGFRDFHQQFLRDDARVHSWSDSVNLDLHKPDNVRKLLLKSALLANDKGITLVYSSKPEHIHENVALAGDVSLERSAQLFLDLARAADSPKP
jgi:D-threo-aldose 1-dehydrogenase